GQVDRMLADLTEALSALPSGFAAPVGIAYDRDSLAGRDVLSQAYAFVRDALRPVGPHDLPAAVHRVLARPHERLVREDRDLPVGAVDRLDGSALVGIASFRQGPAVAPEAPSSPAASAAGSPASSIRRGRSHRSTLSRTGSFGRFSKPQSSSCARSSIACARR